MHLANLLARWAGTEKQIGTPALSAAAFDEASDLCRQVLAEDPGRVDVTEVLDYCAEMRPAEE